MTHCHARHNIMALKCFTFLDALYPMSILLFVWFYQVTGSYTTAAMMFVIQTIAQALLEIPTGILSDKYSRVFNLRCSAFLWFLCMFIEAAAGFSSHGTMMLMIGATLGGAAGAMNSGTMEALIYETLADCRKQNKFDFVYSRINFWSQVAAMCGAIIAGGIMLWGDIYMLAWTTAVVGFLFFVSSFFIYEPTSRQKSSNTSSVKLLWTAVRQMWRDKELRTMVGINALSQPVAYQTEGAYFASLIPAPLIPFARMFRQFTGAIGFYLAAWVRKIGFFQTLVYSNVGYFVAKVIGLTTNNIASPFILSSTNLLYGFNTTAYNAILQERFSDQQRATMQNIQSIVGSIGGGVLLFTFGKIADNYSILTAMWCTAGLDFIVAFAYWKLFKKQTKRIKNEKF